MMNNTIVRKKLSEYEEYLLSDENIYHAIYSLESYVFDYELLEPNDKILFHRLKDKFSEELISDITNQVRDRITDLLEKDEYVKAKVFFRPKKFDEGEKKLVFRPLHTTDLITQIAIVSMLHLFIYDRTDENELILSNLSRLIPANFYGNRVSVNPAFLFKPWKKQYQKYNQKANDAMKKYHTSLEYKYEVTLDLENFFPTINPAVIYKYIMCHLPAYMNQDDKKVMGKVLHKLLFCKLETKLDRRTDMRKQYYEVSKNKNERSISDKIISTGFVRGIPQGLPQSYFLGNVYMLIISRIFEEVFPGVSYFYVDDSVIFTNAGSKVKEEFEKKLEEINSRIKQEEDKYLVEGEISVYPDDTEKFYKSDLYGVMVHTKNKSSCICLDTLDESDLYLKCISRAVSQGGSDFFRMYSDEENRNLEKKFDVLSKQIRGRYQKLEEEKKSVDEDNTVRNVKKIQDKLNRYYKFFEYRRRRLTAMHEPDVSAEDEEKDKQKREYEKIIYGDPKDPETEKVKVICQKVLRQKITGDEKIQVSKHFIELYCKNIWDASVAMYLQIADKKEKQKLSRYICAIDKICFGKRNASFSYIAYVYQELLSKEWKREYSELHLRLAYDDPYKSLKEYAVFRLKNYSNKHYKVAEEFCEKIAEKKTEDVMEDLLPVELIKRQKIVFRNTQQITRMVMNTIYSYLFNVEISDNLIIAKYSRKILTYGELRILVFLRNRLFRAEEFQNRKISLKEAQNVTETDYSIMKVIEIFHSFVKDPVWIDELILTHKYTCDVWKNGSKYLYFYTLHNQEHAIVLIQNIVRLIHAIDFFKITAVDFYLLFQACYLHDISMVKIPDRDGFLTDTEEADQIAYKLYQESRQGDTEEEPDILEIKTYMLNSYKLLDEYFERGVRNRHADDSAAEIRNVSDIAYIDSGIREFVAEISEAHCADERDIYGAKSIASRQLVSMKFDKILIRLADLLDMNEYRVSRPILNHNIDQMSLESAFHWISHLLIQDYKIETEYEIRKEFSLVPKSIAEKLVFVIPVSMAQMSACGKNKPCKNIRLDRENISKKEMKLICGESCDGKDQNCNFLCQWFCVKNSYMVKEFAALREYLRQNPNNYFESEIEIRIQCDNRAIDEKQFEILSKYLEVKNKKSKGNFRNV